MNTPVLRFPAEWEPQSAVLIAWPHAGTDWAQRLGEVEDTYVALVAAITRFQPAWICVADDDLQTYAEARLRSARVDMDQVRFIAFDYDDTWLRDSGPIVLREGDGFRVLDFHFTAWGGKFEAGRDDRLVESLASQGVFGDAPRQRIDFALEGGGIETDGAGSLLTTWQCLHERHPQADRAELDSKLRDWLAQDRVLWLDRGWLEGDD
ncbi:MAG: agmatine deiminase family protein, partial [Pseudoxanthomonas sp.]|nr:agmatine deiminase family protein [Pseudoxanthomonas sp.]